MFAYSDYKKYNYDFVGVFTVDFAVKESNGKCKYYDNKCIKINYNTL